MMAVRKRAIVIVVCVLALAGILAGVGVHLWQQHQDKLDAERAAEEAPKTLSLGEEVNVYISEKGQQVYFVVKALQTIGNSTELGAQLGIGAQGMAKPCETQSDGSVCVVWEDGTKVTVAADPRSPLGGNIECLTMSWNVSKQGSGSTPVDCYDMSKMSWFGAYEDHLQLWPINQMNIPATPFLTGDVFSDTVYGQVVEPLFVASGGFGFHVLETVPLYVAINGNSAQPSICLVGQTTADTPFYAMGTPWLSYDICRAKDISVLWQGMSEKYVDKPTDYPSEEVVKAPIWSTWARYKADINQSKALEFAAEIVLNNMSISQLEIDDDWTSHYGDFTFNTDKFPDALEMVNRLNGMGIPTTLWMHPYINRDADAYEDLSKKGYLVKLENGSGPADVGWWRGNGSGLIDFTNPGAVEWYSGKLAALKKDFNVTSFKFDAGEASSLPKRYSLSTPLATPSYFTTKYVETAHLADENERRQEVRVGFRSQKYPVMVRMLDRQSDWSHEMGLRSLIPAALAFGLAGYHFVLPDMVGGNAYDDVDIDDTVLPEKELYIRWLQATLFLPTMQFSVPPWDYNDQEVVDITHDMLNLRSRHLDRILQLWKETTETGLPVVRPLWWADPLSQDAIQCDSEFLVGDDLLVAPILEKGATKRDVFLPSGNWVNGNTNETVRGGKFIRNVEAKLDALPHFIREPTTEQVVG